MEEVNKENNTNIEIPKLKSNTLIYKGKFLSYFIKEYEITNKNNQNSTILKPYETIDYNSRCFNQNEIPNEFVGKNNYNIYAVNIIPIIKYSSKLKKIILISVFRYPINKLCLEFPGGFIDKTDIESTCENFSDGIKNSALRELEEETGYIGKFISFTSKYFSNNSKSLGLEQELKIGSNIFFDPWKSSDNSIQCLVEINGDDVKNKKCQKLDDNEIIKVFEVEISDLMKFINEKVNKEGYGCSSELYNFALGLSFNEIIKNIENN